MILTRVKKVLALVVAVVVFQVATMSSEAHARWRDNSDQLPTDDGSSAASAGAIVALGVLVVGGVIYAIVKWNQKQKSLAEVAPVTNEDTVNLATFRELKNDVSTNQNALKDNILVTALSVRF